MIETHISWIFLTGTYVYKVKKALKFGNILDFSTLYLRKKNCKKEVDLNRFLCGDLYRGVMKIVRSNTGELKMVDLNKKGKALEYCVKMCEISQEFLLDNLLNAGLVNKQTIAKLASILARFHSTTPTNPKIQRFGKPEFMKIKIDENFATMSEIGISGGQKYYDKLYSFIDNNKDLFLRRIKIKKVRDIHGDLYLRNIFIVGNRFYLYDRIEFNDNLRYADVAEDVAHLAMDLDSHGRMDLRETFIYQYIRKSKDNSLNDIIYFLMCYKACMRAKVSFFNAMHEMKQEKKNALMKEGDHLLKLAESYFHLF